MTRPLFAIDPGARVVRWGWWLWAAWGVIGSTLLAEDLRLGRFDLGAVLSAPLWLMWFLWPAYRIWGAWARRFEHSRWAMRQGSHYEFDGQPIRIVFAEDAIYFAAEDVFDALRLGGHLRDPERGRLIAGRDGLTELPGSQLLVFSEVGLRAWLERRQDADAIKFARWMDKQVIDPYRRRRELGAPPASA